MYKVISCICFAIFSLGHIQAQYHHGGHGQHHQGDSTHRSFNPPKIEKGPNKGKMISKDGLKVEMVPPSNTKGDVVTYYVYDSLNKIVDAKTFAGTVKYIFGGPNEYLEAKLIPTGATNQYAATLEGWQEYKKAVVTLKANEKVSTFTFVNFVPSQTNNGSQGGHHGGGHGGHGGHHGGGGGGGGNFGGGGMGMGGNQ